MEKSRTVKSHGELEEYWREPFTDRSLEWGAVARCESGGLTSSDCERSPSELISNQKGGSL